MNSIQFTPKLFLLFFAGMVCLTLSAVVVSAQVRTQTTTESGSPEKAVTVERGEVAYVSANELVVRMEDGELRHFTNVPESARVTVGGQQLGIHDLKPGMKLERTTIRTTTPQTIKTVQTVTGKVWSVNPPNFVILTLEDGTNQRFKIPNGQQFNIEGQMTDAWGLKKGMKVSATRIVEESQTMVEEEKKVTGSNPPPPPVPAPNVPILVAITLPTVPPPSAPLLAKAELPKTGSPFPLIGLLGIMFVGMSVVLRLVRSAA